IAREPSRHRSCLGAAAVAAPGTPVPRLAASGPRTVLLGRGSPPRRRRSGRAAAPAAWVPAAAWQHPAGAPVPVTAGAARLRSRPVGVRPAVAVGLLAADRGPVGGGALDRHRGRLARPTPARWAPAGRHRLDHRAAAGLAYPWQPCPAAAWDPQR